MHQPCIVAFCGKLSLAGTSLAYLVYGGTLAADIVNVRLKTLTPIEVGAIAFFGEKKTDMDFAILHCQCCHC